MPENALFSSKTTDDEKQLFDPAATLWRKSPPAEIARYWNGASAAAAHDLNWSNLTRVRSAWNETHLFFYFEAFFDELNVDPNWTTRESVHGLWEKDVVEVFLQPEAREDYFEIEVSPLGQWLDAHIREPRVDVNFSWSSSLSLRVFLEKEEGVWRAFLGLPFRSLAEEERPGIGSVWHLNLFRIAGQEPGREYLAWRPTFTEKPDFHRPASFGYLFFLDSQ